MNVAKDTQPAIDLQEILVPIPPLAEVVTTGSEDLRPKFNLTDEQIKRLGRRLAATSGK